MAQETALQERKGKELEQPERTSSRPTWTPRCDIFETEQGLTILADMPGVDEKNVGVSVEKGILTISGTAGDVNWEGYERIYTEYRVGAYERSFRISEDFDVSKIDATLKHGVLKVLLPKSERAQPRKITVKAG